MDLFMFLRYSAVGSVLKCYAVCLSVRLFLCMSVMFVYSVETSKPVFTFFTVG